MCWHIVKHLAEADHLSSIHLELCLRPPAEYKSNIVVVYFIQSIIAIQYNSIY